VSAELIGRLSAALPIAATLPVAAAAFPLAAAVAAPLAAAARLAGTPASLDMLGTRLSSVGKVAASALSELPIKTATGMDPRLQLALANFRTGKRAFALTSTTGDEVAVVARVRSVEDWQAISDVAPGSELGRSGEDTFIVTGRIPIQRVEAVRAEPTIVSLKASQPVRPALAATVAAMGVAPEAIPAGRSPEGGRGVVVGIVDFGCDFVHRNFCRDDGTTRLLALWHQAGVAMPNSPFGYGRVYTTAEIDAALQAPNPYAVLRYGPFPDDPTQPGTHGTHVMDIAAGNGLGSGQPGVAPNADLVFVEVASSDIPWSGPEAVNKAFGDSVQLLEAVRFIFDAAGDRPCVCNISLGTNGGPHDGTSLVEQGLDALLRERPDRAVVIAASNSQDDKIHTSGEVPGEGAHDIVWRQAAEGGGELELWYSGQRRLQVTIVAADGTAFGPVQPGDNLPVGTDGKIAIFISNRLDDPNNHDNVISVWLAADLPGEGWTVRLISLDGNAVAYHAWIERDDGRQASFAAPVPTHTLGSISTGHETIVVGCYDAHKPQFPIASFSSAGPTRDGRQKPEVSAPGRYVMAARSMTRTGVVKKSGTSMAAPAVTGLVALIFAEAHRNGVQLPIDRVRNQLMNTAQINPPSVAQGGWDPRFGFGRANSGSI
jgi:subtilisin family serine protease